MAEAKYPARIYRPAHKKQKLRTPDGQLIGCTDTCLAMYADAISFGAVRITELMVRNASDERLPDPASPGLNIPQIIQVAKRMHFPLADGTGRGRADVRAILDRNARVIAQIWWSSLGTGGTPIGHAILLNATRERPGAPEGPEVLIDDPMRTAAQWVPEANVYRAMADWANRTNVPGTGLRFAYGPKLPYVAAGAR